MNYTEVLKICQAPEAPTDVGGIDFLNFHFNNLPGFVQLVTIGEYGIAGVAHAKCDDVQSLSPFIDKHNKKDNSYFCVNPVREPVTDENGTPKKAAEADILCMSYLHVDIDPNIDLENGITLESERERIFHEMEGVDLTALVDSGGGYQAFWRLNSPIMIQEENRQKQISDLKNYNILVRDRHGGDSCQDLSRLMRLPGTWNLPNEKKRKQGRKSALASVVRLEDKTFNLSEFELTDLEPVPVATTNLDQLENLPISDNCVELIVTGKHPEREFESRSEKLFSALCALTLAGVDGETILTICRNPTYKISEKPLENSEEWLRKEIERATEFVTPDFIRELNEKYFVAMDGGKTLVFKEDFDLSFNRPALRTLRFQDLRDFFCNQPVVDHRGKDSTKGVAWLRHPARRQYESLILQPGGAPLIGNNYNLWQGYGVESVPGDYSCYKDHLFRNICAEDHDLFTWVWNWMAAAVQRPSKPAEIAIVLRGDRGTGKGLFAKYFGQLFGSHFLPISSPKHLVGNFNVHLRTCIVLFADEAFWAGDHQATSRLKALITESTISIEPKFRDVISVPNMLHILMASNNAWVVPAGNTERRFLVLDVANTQAQNHTYFGELVQQMEAGGGSAALLHALHETNLSSWNHRVAPKTKALLEQQLMTMGSIFGFWYRCLRDGGFGPQFSEWSTVGRRYLYQRFREYCRNAGMGRPGDQTRFGVRLRELIPGKKLKRGPEVHWESQHEGLVTERSYQFPLLADCRKHFCERMGWDSHDWGDEENYVDV